MRTIVRLLSVCLLVSTAVFWNHCAAKPLSDDLRAVSDSLDTLDNAYVRVLHSTSACGPAHTEGFGTRTIVALTKVSIRSSRGTLRLERGQVAVFLVNESYDSPTGEYFEVAFKLKHPPLKSPEQWLEPIKNTIVYEDKQFRVFEERLKGGDERPLHSHAQRVVVRLNEVQLTDPRLYPIPLPGTGIQVPNTVRFAEPIVHAVKNVSKDSLFNIVIEFKLPQKEEDVPPNPQADSARQLVYSDDFGSGSAQWLTEFENVTSSRLSTRQGSLEVNASAGATIWFRNKLSGNVMITYTVTVIDSGGVNDRVSDLNAFWMAQDPTRDLPFGRNGKFSSYDDLQLYYAGIGGHDNTTSRFRKYEPGKGKDVFKEYLDKDHLLQGNKKYSITITVRNGRTKFYVNDVLYFEYVDQQPLLSGYFAFRTTRSHQRFERFRIYTMAP